MTERYIMIKELFNDIEAETKKAFKISGVWIPKSQGYVTDDSGKNLLYVKKWLAFEVQVKIHKNEEMRKIRKLNEILS